MSLLLLKPVLWNTNNYQKPSGWKVSGKSYPALHGFGHEEWNNSPRLAFSENGQRYRAFHTERCGNAPTEENRGQTFVFMIASHEGVQQLVGVAGNAHYIGGLLSPGADPHVSERKRIAKLLDLSSLGEEAWEVSRVKTAMGNSKAAFNAVWRKDVSWICNWICPEEFFWWPSEPITLQATEITGKQELPKMFSIYMSMELSKAEAIMGMVPVAQRSVEWTRLVDAMRVAPAEPVAHEQAETRGAHPTTQLSLALARIGQGKFRTDLLKQWGGCAVTGVGNGRVLRASHVKPWKVSTDKERLDSDNGLLLCANLDALFDAGLISFAHDGTMLVSDELDNAERKLLGVPKRLRRPPTAAQRGYLDYHRAVRFRQVGSI